MKRIKVKFCITAIAAAILLLTGGGKHIITQAASDDYHFVISGNHINDQGEAYITNADTQIYVNGKDNSTVKDAVIQWVSSNPEVVSFNTEASLPSESFAMLKRNGPGSAMITAIITTDEGEYKLSCNVTVQLQINYDPGKTPALETVYTGQEAMVLNVGVTQEIFLKYVSTSETVNNSLVTWESSRRDVAYFESDGILKTVGSGLTTITITTNTASSRAPQKLTFELAVIPGLNGYTESPPEIPLEKYYKITRDPNVPATGILNTDAAKASYLTWEVRDSQNKTVASSADGLMDYDISEVSGNFIINDVKAGTYNIYAYVAVGGRSGKDVQIPYIHIKYVVPVNITIGNITMNIDDTYSLTQNSNIPSAEIFNYTVKNTAGIPDNSVAKINSSTGVITAVSPGTAIISFTYVGGSALLEDPPVIAPITITVIDGIKLNMTEATIYVGGTLELVAQTSYDSAKINWSSSDESVVKIVNGIITGVAEGRAVVTASQTIHGVVKSATCVITVQPTIEKITINPSSVTLDEGDFKTLVAVTEPADLHGVKLKWISSDTSVVDISIPDDLSATIKATGGGTAVVFAINQDNIIVGFCKVTVRIKVQSITLNETSVKASKSTPKLQLRAIISPANATDPSIKWTSTNSNVASVSADGLVTFVNPGVATIIATSVSNPDVTATCNIAVDTSVASIILDETTKTMYVGESTRLTYMILPTNSTNKEVEWSSSNTAVVSIDASGLLSAKAAGVATVTIKTKDGSLSKSCTITVIQKATGVSMDVKDLELNVGQSYTLKVTFTPANSTETHITWSSSDDKIAKVDSSGRVTGVATGKTVIIAKLDNGTTVYCNVTVTQAATGLTLNFEEKTIVVGEKFTIKATVQPSDASSLNVTWSSSNSKVISLSSTGTVEGLARGASVITCTTADGKFSATCVVEVIEPVTSIKLSKTSYKLGVGKSYTLKATVTSNAATNPKVTWVSSNKSIATVDSKGKVTAKKLGYVTITAKAQDKSGEEASCEIRIVRAVTSVSISRTSVTVVEGRTVSLKATIRPTNATYKTANWQSSDEEVAIVSPSGVITGLKEGTAIITAAAKDSSGKSAKCHVVVKPVTPASSVTILNENLTMIAGETSTLQKAISPASSTDRFTWESDNKQVASVDRSTGKVTARTPGVANVTVMTESGKTATTKVTVVGLNTTSLELEQYSQYRLEVIGADSLSGSGSGNAPVITWDVADSEIAVVNNGLVESRRTGTTTITAIVNGRRLTCKLKVIKIR